MTEKEFLKKQASKGGKARWAKFTKKQKKEHIAKMVAGRKKKLSAPRT